MKVLIRKIFLSVVFLLFCSSALAQTDSATELAQLLGQYKTYKANFRQLTYYSRSQQPQKSSGRLYMERPGKFRWEINKPSQQIIIANQSTLWVYDVELEQVTKQKIDLKSSNNPAVLLSGDVNQLIQQYEVSKVQEKGTMWYQLKPRSAQPTFVLIRMRFANNQLVAIWVKNNLDQISIFQFSHIQLNKTLSASLFHFKPPPGVDVLQ